MTDQLSLFGGAPARTQQAPVAAAPVPPATRELAGRRPAGLYLGTSSWSFPGWDGLVWDGRVSERTLSKHGLSAYAAHPLLNAVGLDRTHYAPMRAPALQAYADQVPGTFRFLMKAHDAITLRVFPKHARYGARAGQENPHYLDADYALDEVLGPAAEGLGDKLFVVLFQFAPQSVRGADAAKRFAEELSAFFTRLPRQMNCAVEVRNSELLTDDYRDALQDAGVLHCLSSLPQMPSLREQARLLRKEQPDPVIIRWMLNPRYRYQEAYQAYHPFREVVDIEQEMRAEVAMLTRRALSKGRKVMVIANNKAEGCAPKSLEGILQTLLSMPEEASP